MANTAWALASSRHYDGLLLDALSARALQLAKDCLPQTLANVVWSLALLNHRPDEPRTTHLQNALAAATRRKLADFSLQQVWWGVVARQRWGGGGGWLAHGGHGAAVGRVFFLPGGCLMNSSSRVGARLPCSSATWLGASPCWAPTPPS